MSIITLAEAKNQCRVTDTAQDVVLQIYVNAADEYISKRLEDTVWSPSNLLKAAALLFVSSLYENREEMSQVQLYKNPTVDRIIDLYRSYGV